MIEHEETLDLEHEDLTVKRFDDIIYDQSSASLAGLLASAPAGFASFADRWSAHTPPIQRLKLCRVYWNLALSELRFSISRGSAGL